jgi:hypothetical protein
LIYSKKLKKNIQFLIYKDMENLKRKDSVSRGVLMAYPSFPNDLNPLKKNTTMIDI